MPSHQHAVLSSFLSAAPLALSDPLKCPFSWEVPLQCQAPCLPSTDCTGAVSESLLCAWLWAQFKHYLSHFPQTCKAGEMTTHFTDEKTEALERLSSLLRSQSLILALILADVNGGAGTGAQEV